MALRPDAARLWPFAPRSAIVGRLAPSRKSLRHRFWAGLAILHFPNRLLRKPFVGPRAVCAAPNFRAADHRELLTAICKIFPLTSRFPSDALRSIGTAR